MRKLVGGSHSGCPLALPSIETCHAAGMVDIVSLVIYIYIYIYISACVCVCVFVCVCVLFVYVCLCVCIQRHWHWPGNDVKK